MKSPISAIGDLGGKLLHTLFLRSAHTEDSAATLCNVAHDVAEVFVGHIGCESAYRLKYGNAAFGIAFLYASEAAVLNAISEESTGW